MSVQENKVVSLSFELHIDHEEDGRVLVEKASAENPFVFLYGESGLPEKFEEHISGKNQGDAFEFVLESDDAYGDYDEGAIIDLPKDVFKGNEDVLEEGNRVPLTDEQGETVIATILEVNENVVVVDLNHPLSGYDLFFTGTVDIVRDATEEEIEHGHVHGEHGHHH